MSHKADNLFIDPSSASMKAILQHNMFALGTFLHASNMPDTLVKI